ncbi:hypothetical protein Tco_1572514, partial [Tanacetum coccineum]
NGYMWYSLAPRHHGGAPAHTRSERVLEKPNEPPLSEGNTSKSGDGRMEHQFELTANVPIKLYDSPFPGGYTPRSDEEAEEESNMAFELIKFIKSMLEE